jgi:hypothetical protein
MLSAGFAGISTTLTDVTLAKATWNLTAANLDQGGVCVQLTRGQQIRERYRRRCVGRRVGATVRSLPLASATLCTPNAAASPDLAEL